METKIAELEKLVRQGLFDEVALGLRKLGQPSRKDAVVVAKLARRCTQPAFAVKILNPIVRPRDRFSEPASEIEKIEYAEALRQVGAVDEAWQLLSEADSARHHEVLLYKVFCLFNQWDYQQALPLLHEYILKESLTEYEKCIGLINLAAAYIQLGELKNAVQLLDEVRLVTDKSGMKLLYGNSLELSAQVAILKNDFELAISISKASSELLKRAGGVLSLFPEKWMAIAESLKNKQVMPELYAISAKAQQVRHWETVRDCEFYITYLKRDWESLKKIYFGTPYVAFRQRLLNLTEADFSIQQTFIFSPQSNPTSILDLRSGTLEGERTGSLPIGQALHRFFILLSRDMYRPMLAVTAFGKLFPDEFMSEFSVNRVHQIVKRSRDWLKEVQINIQIEELDGSYRIVLGEDVGLRLTNNSLPLETKELEMLLLEKRLGLESFNIRQATEILSSSASNTQRLLRWAIEAGRVLKEGSGSKTRYRIPLRRAEV